MPIYEYECKSCGVRFERKQSMSDEPVSICPECGGPVRKLFFPAGIIFKGSGFYKTDNASGGSSTTISKEREKEKAEGKERDKEPTADSGKAAAKTESKTDAKPVDAGKSEAKSTESAKT